MKKLEDIFFITLKKYSNKTENLIAVDYEKDLNFNIKRSFIVTSSKNIIRGKHAHKGSCEITCDDG